MRNSFTIRYILTGVIWVYSALFSPNANAKNLTWTATVSLVQEKNEELRAAEAQLQSKEFDLKASYGGYMPAISANANYNYSGSETTGGTSESRSYSAGLMATQEIFSGLKDSAKVDQARGQRDLSLLSLQMTKSRISYELKTAYAGLAFAQRSIKMSEEIKSRREANLRLVELRFESGRENKGAVLLSKAYLEESKLDLLEAQQNLSIAQSQLGKLLAADPLEVLVVEDNVPVIAPLDDLDFQQLSLQVPAYKQSLVQESIADAGVTLARGGFFPTLSVTAQTGDTGPEWYPDNNRWSVGATITLPLFNGGQDFYGTKSSLESRRVATLQKEFGLKAGVVSLKKAHSEYLQAVQKLRTDKAFVEALSIREIIAKEQYNNGLLTFNDWDVIENDLVKRQRNVLQSEKDRVTAEAAWEQVLGKGVFNDDK